MPSAIHAEPQDILSCMLLNTQYPIPNTHYPIPITHHPLPITHHPPPTTHHPYISTIFSTNLPPAANSRRQSQLSQIAKAALLNNHAALHPPPSNSSSQPLTAFPGNLLYDCDFAVRKPQFDNSLTLPPPVISAILSRGFHQKSGMSRDGIIEGVGHPLSDTPLPSGPSTAQSSPRM